MKILSIESASATASCAVSQGEEILGEYTLNHKKTHSEKLMPLIEDLMKDLQLKISDMDYIAISRGPGSYTGLRIGAAIGKSMAYAGGMEIISVPTLQSLAANIYHTDKLIVPVMDARGGRIYTGIYKWEKGMCTDVTEQFPSHIDELLEMLKDYQEPIIFNGDGSVNYREKIQDKLKEKAVFAPERFNYLSAATLASIAYTMALRGETVKAKDFKPEYLRMSQAERTKK